MTPPHDDLRALAVWTKVADGHPPRHARYAVRRGGLVFTATPCYGMHAPWWVVRTMADGWPNEAEPVDMQSDDQWMPIAAFTALLDALRDMTQERDDWMASSAGYGSDMVEWKIRAQHAESALQDAQRENERLRRLLDVAAPYSCPECGPHIKVDEDECCASCGHVAYLSTPPTPDPAPTKPTISDVVRERTGWYREADPARRATAGDDREGRG